jgi:hypothetical protein
LKIPKLSLNRLVFLITLLALFAMAARISVDSDTWWHLRAGQWIVENSSFPQIDPFSYTRAGEPWCYPGWLVEVPLYWIYQFLGPGGLNLWTAAMVTLTFWFVWHTLSGGKFLRAFVIILAAAASGIYWSARPYLLTFLFSAVYLFLLEADKENAHSQIGAWRGYWRLWVLPVLMIIWANSHGGFVVGFIVWGVYFVSAFFDSLLEFFSRDDREARGFSENFGRMLANTRLRVLGIVGLLLVLAVCINPNGPAMLLYPFKTVGIDVLHQFIQEWQSPNFHETSVLPFLWLLLTTIAVLGLSKRRISIEGLLLLIGFAYLSFTAGRNIALFALVSPMVLTRHSVPLLKELGKRLGIRVATQTPIRLTPVMAFLNWIILGILVLAVGVKVSQITPLEPNQAHFKETLPVEAVDFIIAEQPNGRILNSYNWGAYLLWALPEYPVFVDGRTDVYGDELIGEWIRIVQGETGWQDSLDQWGVNLILLEPTRPLITKLASHGWDLIYADEIAVIYSR